MNYGYTFVRYGEDVKGSATFELDSSNNTEY